jgi:transcriptional adapter 1
MLVLYQVHKSALPSHTVYTLNVERILNRLSHPSREELEQEDISREEAIIKRQLSEQQMLFPAASGAAYS